MFRAPKRVQFGPFISLVLAVLAVLLAFFLRELLNKEFGIELPPFILFYPTVLMVGVLFGLWPGLLATSLATALTDYWFMPPIGHFSLQRPSDAIALTIFFVMGTVFSFVAERFRLYQRQVAAQESSLKVRSTQTKLDAALRNLMDAVFLADPSGAFLNFNDAFITFHRFKSKDECPKTLAELASVIDMFMANGDPAPIFLRPVQSALRGYAVTSAEYTLRRKDTGEAWIGSYSFAPIRDVDGAIVGAVVSARDITEQKRIEHDLRASEERYHAAFQTSLDAICINQMDNSQYLDVNQAFLDMLGYERAEVVGRTPLELGVWADPNQRELILEQLRQGLPCRDIQIQFVRKNGEVFWGAVSTSRFGLNGDNCVHTVIRDISQAKSAEEEIRNLAFYDPLTGLANRRLLMDRLQKSMTDRSRGHRNRALLFVDLDGFKTLNDTLGHEIGDLLLREVGHRLTASVRKFDTVGRLGGDEFLVMLEDLSEVHREAQDQARHIAEKILSKVDEPYKLNSHDCFSTCSIGITVFGSHQEKVSEVLQQADIAMYQAKAVGRNTLCFFAPSLQTAVDHRAEMEEELRHAIKAGQFQLYYQPQVVDGRLGGAEALLRWNHPSKGILLPDVFIPVAESTRLILHLGDWVLESACRQIAAWSTLAPKLPLSVSVNISAMQLLRPEFVETVLGVLERTGANPECLELEVTETIFMENIEEVIVKMKALKAHGLHFTVDDFGTGYSSLSYLRRLPLDRLKIDRSFVHDLVTDASSGAIAQAIVALSRALELDVIAEGVETEPQREFLAHAGCHSYQGFLFSPPLPKEEFERLAPEFVERAATQATV